MLSKNLRKILEKITGLWSYLLKGQEVGMGNQKPFKKGGLLTLFEQIPEAKILPVSIGNSWKLSRYNYFPMPLAVSLDIMFHPITAINTQNPEATVTELESIIHEGVRQLQTSA